MWDRKMSMSLYEEIKGWQSGIGSLLGFVALMVGALWNFRLNRRRDAALRAEEVTSVAAALYGEIVLLQMEVAAVARAVAQVSVSMGTERDPIIKFDTHFIAAHVISEAILYKALANKLGLLPAELIIAITAFHKNIQQVRTALPLLIDDRTRGYTYGAGHVLVPARDAAFDIVPTLRMIEQMANIPKRATPIDLGQAEGIIEMEREIHEIHEGQDS
jgi:hypothetical protein